MAKPKEKKKHPKPPENAPSVIAIKKLIEERKARLAQRQAEFTKEGKLDRQNPKYRVARKRLKRVQRKLLVEGVRLQPKGKPAENAPGS